MTVSGTSSFSEEIRSAGRFQREGQTLLAETTLRTILARDENHHAANYLLGMLYHQQQQSIRAISFLQRAVAARPDDFVAVFNLGVIQHELGLLADAQHSLQQAALLALENAPENAPQNARLQVLLAVIFRDQGYRDEALAAVDRSLALDPADADAWVTKGSLLQAGGDMEAAIACYEKALLHAPLHGDACYRLSLLDRLEGDAEQLRKMESGWQAEAVPPGDRILIGYALGRAYESQRQFDRAFGYFQAANELQRRSLHWPLESSAGFFERHQRGFSQSFVDRCKDQALSDSTPIFIVGMPRSGTSLVEQILASHPAVHGAGEVAFSRIFEQAVEQRSGQPFPLGIDAVDPAVLAESCRDYIGKLRSHAGAGQGAEAAAAKHVTDKLPHNFLRIGLYAAMLPNAKIVLVERDPLDNCLSIYQHFFTAAHGYATDLTDLGCYYRLYQDLIAHWDNMFPGRIHHLRYEALVQDTESQVRLLLAHCGLEFDPACLAFHQTKRSSSTPSDAQVRKPVYQGAVGRWQNYAKHLGLLQEALGS
ncbi:MAG: sulfotransferase family protein [Xanthomonadales bacterium]|nr:sulfotransferase family protein [Xanthomonadales bacterium]